ncbi:hypothetical protein F2Q70_00002249 [Brassica cretica]|uniref:Uncharacterized protein n=1 Tax=Brassica cretica TaxID=69181 RepID=A0A8S9ITQ1_BRACR|nr:hypothetical protein F2Q70_00002249 [Brassica cretica]
MQGGGLTSSGFSSVRIPTEISKRIFPSVWFLISSVALLFCPHEIMSTLFFGAGGGEFGDSCSISLPLLFVVALAFRLDFGVTGSSSSPTSSSSRFFGCVTLVRAILFFQGCNFLFVLVADGVRFPGIEWFGGEICVLGSPCLYVDLVWNWIEVLRGHWSPVSISSSPLRLGSLECRTVQCFGGSTSSLTDRGVSDFFPEYLQLNALVVIIPRSSVSSPRVWARGVSEISLDWDRVRSSEDDLSPGRFLTRAPTRCVGAVSVASLVHVNPVGVTPALESDPIGSMSLTPDDVVPVVWLGSIVALKKLRSVS